MDNYLYQKFQIVARVLRVYKRSQIKIFVKEKNCDENIYREFIFNLFQVH